MTEVMLRGKLEAWRALGRAPNFGIKVALERHNVGLTQLQLAKMSGVPRSTISEIESGKTKAPKAATVEKIIDALDAALSERSMRQAATRNATPPAPETSREPGVVAAADYLEKQADRRRALARGRFVAGALIVMAAALAVIIAAVLL